MATINSVVDAEMAELVATDAGVELDIRKPQDAEERLAESLKEPDDPADLQPRAPIVTIMGHVDHGKTSLLDKIRHSNVVATEAGGITQVIRAWRVEHNGKPITFLDTPGHEAFTKMRARGANVTDIAVIVVAADDGVMPQTEEAINHAKAAGVSIVVAINKVDMPNANVSKTRQQLYGLGRPARQHGRRRAVRRNQRRHRQGHRRAARSDLAGRRAEGTEGQPEQAGPRHLPGGPPPRATRACSPPCWSRRARSARATSSCAVPATAGCGRCTTTWAGRSARPGRASRCGSPAWTRCRTPTTRSRSSPTWPGPRDRREAASPSGTRPARPPRSAARWRASASIKMTELKVILKADFRGSIEAIRKELEKLQHEEVRVRLLHTGIGASPSATCSWP